MQKQKNKSVNLKNNKFKKNIPHQEISYSSDKLKPIWIFDKIDKGGLFAFDVDKENFQHHKFLSKMINYSTKTWDEIKKETHDKANKSKHHYLGNSLSLEAQKRLSDLKLTEYFDDIFSFSFSNKLRIVGIREDEKFYVLWYDSEHKVSESKLKNT